MYFEDFTVGQVLRTRGRTVFDHDIGALIALAGLYEELFMNREYVERASVFGRRVAPGLLTLCIAEGLVMSEEWYRNTGLAFLGLDGLRLHAPVSPGDTLWVTVRIVETRPGRQPDRGVVVAEHTVENQAGVAVMTFRIARLVRRRPVLDVAGTEGSG
ncbi:MAG: MaoC family dehydratase N-terminal domain-containing protein [Chloroflexi bacterium]|nr:MaoC family dehydratase N-terminal domain-containing protein [Chloroflexota bacterium]